MGRLGNVDELNNIAIFLASNASSFMTGSDLIIDVWFYYISTFTILTNVGYRVVTAAGNCGYFALCVILVQHMICEALCLINYDTLNCFLDTWYRSECMWRIFVINDFSLFLPFSFSFSFLFFFPHKYPSSSKRVCRSEFGRWGVPAEITWSAKLSPHKVRSGAVS